MAWRRRVLCQPQRWSSRLKAAYIAADALWSDWVEQSPATQDALIDSPRDAFFNGSNFLGTYSTGMLRIGYLFE